MQGLQTMVKNLQADKTSNFFCCILILKAIKIHLVIWIMGLTLQWCVLFF